MLYKLNRLDNRHEYQKVKRVALADLGWKEKDLERLMSHNIQDFISSNDLMTIFIERSRQEEPDIMALDRYGDLYIFELNGGVASRKICCKFLGMGSYLEEVTMMI